MYADCYVLTDKRNKETITYFLEEFIPHRKETIDEYEIPQFSPNPKIAFTKAEELIDYAIANKGIEQSVYWNNTIENDKLRSAMCFFTKDGYLILGISCITNNPNTSIEDYYLAKLKKYLQTDIGYIDYENPPPDNKEKFINLIQKLDKK